MDDLFDEAVLLRDTRGPKHYYSFVALMLVVRSSSPYLSKTIEHWYLQHQEEIWITIGATFLANTQPMRPDATCFFYQKVAVEAEVMTLSTCAGKRACISRRMDRFAVLSPGKDLAFGYSVFDDPTSPTCAQKEEDLTVEVLDDIPWPQSFPLAEVPWLVPLAKQVAMYCHPIGDFLKQRGITSRILDTREPINLEVHKRPSSLMD